MEEMLNEMLNAGLSVKFCSPTHVQVFPKGSNAWFYGSSFEEVYLLAVEYGRIEGAAA